jgi:hypothetical protein
MTIDCQTKLLLKALEPWAAANAGTVKVANDKPHLFQLLGASPGAPRAAVYFAEEKPRSKKFNDVAGGKPMFILLEEAREEVRGVRLDDIDESRPYYKGTYPIELADATVDAYYIEVVLAADIPQQI